MASGRACARLFVADLGVGVGEREDDRVVGHRACSISGGDHAADGEADEDVGADQRLGQGARRGLGGERRLVGVHVLGPAPVDHAGAVAQDDVLAPRPELEVELGAGERGRAGAGEDDAHLLDLLAGHRQGVEQRGAGDDRRAVLVVVEDRDVHLRLEAALDLEALGGADVLQVDAAEGRLEELDGADELLRVGGVDLDVEDVDVGDHDSKFRTTQTMTTVPEPNTLSYELRTDGWGLTFGGGLEMWISSVFGLYGEFVSSAVKGSARDESEGAVDDRVTSFLFGARVRLGG